MGRKISSRLSFRLLVLAATLAANASAIANYDPRIAYTSYEGKGDTLYLANADGSFRVAVHKTNKTVISGLDLGAGRVAFTELGVLKVLTYTVTTKGITASAPITLDATGAPNQGAAQPDFSPDGNHLLYMRWVQDTVAGVAQWREIRVIRTDGSAPPKVLVTAPQLVDTWHMQSPRWLNSNEFAFVRGGGSPYWSSVMLASLDANLDLTAPPLQLFANNDPGFTSLGVVGFEDFDVSRTGASIVLSANPPSGSLRSFVQFDLVAHTFSKRFSDYGWKGHFQADDASIVYVHLPTSGGVVGDGVYRWLAATNQSTRISGGKGAQTIRFADARP